SEMLCLHLFHLRSCQAERGVVVAALDALERQSGAVLRDGPGVDVALLTGWNYGCRLDGWGFGGWDIRGRRGGAQHVLELDRFGILWTQLEGLGNGRDRVAHIAAACERNGEVELVVGIVRIAIDGFLKERSAIVPAARGRNTLIVYHFG